jgi:hypothetical protein
MQKGMMEAMKTACGLQFVERSQKRADDLHGVAWL